MPDATVSVEWNVLGKVLHNGSALELVPLLIDTNFTEGNGVDVRHVVGHFIELLRIEVDAGRVEARRRSLHDHINGKPVQLRLNGYTLAVPQPSSLTALHVEFLGASFEVLTLELQGLDI